MLQWCRGICWNSRCLDFYDQAEIFCRSMGAFLPPTAEVQAFILSSSPLPDPHLRQSLLSSRTNRCFSCCTVCCLIPRRGTVWCVPMQLSALEGISPWVCKEMQLRTTLGFAAALTCWSLGLESQTWSRRNAKCSAPLLDTQFESLGSFNRLWFQMCESPSIFLMVTCAWKWTVIVPHSDPEETLRVWLNTGSAQYFAFPWIFQSKTTNIANAELYLARKWNQASFWKQTLQCGAEWSSNMVCSSSAELRKNTLCESWKNRRILAKLPGFCPWAGDAAHGLSPCRGLPCMGFATLAMLSLVNVLQVWSLPAFPFHWTGSFQTKLFSLLLVAPLLLGTGGRSQRCTAASPLSPSLDVALGPPSVPANPQKGSPYPVTPSPHSSAIIITPAINSSPTRWSH